MNDDSNWIDELSEKAKKSQDKAHRTAAEKAITNARLEPLMVDFIEKFLAEGLRIGNAFNRSVPGHKAIVGCTDGLVQFEIAECGVTVRFNRDHHTAHETRRQGENKSAAGGGPLREVNGALELKGRTPEQYAKELFKEIAQVAVR